MSLKLSIPQRGLIMVGVPLLLGMVTSGGIAFLLNQAEGQLLQESESKAVINTINHIGRASYVGAQAAVTYALFRSNQSKDEIANQYEMLVHECVNMEELALDNPRQLENVRKLERTANEGLKTLNDTVAVVEHPEKGVFFTQGLGLRGSIFSQLGRLSNEARSIVDEEDKQEHKVALMSAETRSIVSHLSYASMVINVVLALGLALFFTSGITQRLALMKDNAQRLSRREELNQPLGGSDEIAYLDQSFHKMAQTLAEFTRRERALVDKAVDVICAVSENGRFISVNPASMALWGYSPEELVGKRLSDVIAAEDAPRVVRWFQDAVTGLAAKEFDARLKRRNGAVIDTLWSATWSKEEQSLFCVVHDVTARKELERLKQEFVAMVSHDLRTPLTSIQFALEIVLESARDSLPKDALEELEAAERIGSNLINLINGLLDMEKLEAGKLELNRQPMKVSSLINRAVEAVQPIAHVNQVQIVKEQTDAEMVADEDRLLQVLTNLLSNALKFSPRGSTVTIGAQLFDGSIELRVSDQGKGIPSQYKELIFDRFEQIKLSQFRHKGTGLGLSIARALVQAHGGEIGVDSEEGHGASFWFRLPAQVPVSS